jgi:3-oxoadipate enol-lactonase
MNVIKVGDLKIGYNEAGNDGKSLPIIFLHGVGSDKSVWDEQVDYLSKSRRAVAFDYAGYGESDLSPKDLTREEIARLVFASMDALKIENAHVCGLSLGGVIALEMFKQSPERIKSLILADSFVKHTKGDEIIERTSSLVEKITIRKFAEQRVELLLMTDAPKSIRNKVVETFSKIHKQTFQWATRAVWAADYRNLLPSINVPTLVLVGEHDRITPPELSKELAENIRNAKLEIIKNASHLSNLDQPQIFNDLIEKFIKNSYETHYKIADRN